MKEPSPVSESVSAARVRMDLLRDAFEKLRAESMELAERRAALLAELEKFDVRLAELEVSVDTARRSVTSDFGSILMTLESDAGTLRLEWESLRRSLQEKSMTHDVTGAIKRSASPLLRAQTAIHLLRRREGDPSSFRHQSVKR